MLSLKPIFAKIWKNIQLQIMESEIFENIIYGRWVIGPQEEMSTRYGRRGLRPDRHSAGNSEAGLENRWHKRVQSLSESVFKAVKKPGEVPFPADTFTAEDLMFQIEKKQPASPFESHLLELLKLETIRLAGLVVERERSAQSEIDRFYTVTLAMRKWCDYLVDLQNFLHLQSDNDNRSESVPVSIPDVLRIRLLVLICDLSERYSALELKEYFTRDDIYPLLLNRRVPEMPEILPAPALIEKRGAEMALSLLKNGPDTETFNRFSEELDRFASETGNAECDLADEVVKRVHHLENLIFLYVWQERTFMDENREALMNPGTAAEWVQGIREESLEAMNTDMNAVIKKLWRISDQIHSYLPDVKTTGETKGGKKSEARRILEELNEMDQLFFRKPYRDGSKEGETVTGPPSNPFLDQAGEKFISKEHLYDYLGFDNSKSRTTRTAFLKKAGFRYVEITEQKHLVYIEDVEKYLDKKTKRYG